MRIAILGAGFTGLAAGYRLTKNGHEVVIFEKENTLGGLAVGFKSSNWDWGLERAYHHWFTNDKAILKLAKEINQEVIIKKPSTDVFVEGEQLPFDNILALLTFRYLTIFERLRVGLALFYLKITNNYRKFEGQNAYSWIEKWMGQKITKLIWDPLLSGKFGKYKNTIALTWFWARIKKRTQKLAYPKGGFKFFADRLGTEIEKLDGKFFLNTSVTELKSSSKNCQIVANNKTLQFDKIIATLPSSIFTKIAKGLPKSYIRKITSIAHLHAQVLILVLKKTFMKKTYWLNITDKSFPFLILAEHTNFMQPKYYGGEHILYIGNYLPADHPYLKMSKEQLLKKFLPYLKKINSQFSIINSQLFIGPFAQPVVQTNYPALIPTFKTPLKNIYLANLDMVYPWDRGTNYAVELGEKIADIIDNDDFS